MNLPAEGPILDWPRERRSLPLQSRWLRAAYPLRLRTNARSAASAACFSVPAILALRSQAAPVPRESDFQSGNSLVR